LPSTMSCADADRAKPSNPRNKAVFRISSPPQRKSSNHDMK
jgi:hypothetical protein